MTEQHGDIGIFRTGANRRSSMTPATQQGSALGVGIVD